MFTRQEIRSSQRPGGDNGESAVAIVRVNPATVTAQDLPALGKTESKASASLPTGKKRVK